jgi:hypothetical protein
MGRYWSSCWCVEASSYKRNHEQFEEKKPPSVNACASRGTTKYKIDKGRLRERLNK